MVAGATTFEKSTLITADNLATLKALDKYAPLHNPVQVDCIETLTHILPNSVPEVAVFDSQFYLDMQMQPVFMDFLMKIAKNTKSVNTANTVLVTAISYKKQLTF